MAAKRPDTNVTIPKPALDRLSEIDRALGNKSRDQTGRYLLLKYIERNEPLAAADRLTHISTVMRHPLPTVPDEDAVVPTRRLRLRITKSDSNQAREMAFRLPCRAQSRGHTDYQSRLLTDAVMTSIAYECRELGVEPITDQVLEGVHPLLRQRAALGLWRLAVHATRTGAERAILREAEGSREDRETHSASSGKPPGGPRYVEGVAALLEMNDLDDGEAVWHYDHRFQLVQFLASRFSSTRRVLERWEQALYDQEGDDWQELCADSITLGPRPRGMRRRAGRPPPRCDRDQFRGPRRRSRMACTTHSGAAHNRRLAQHFGKLHERPHIGHPSSGLATYTLLDDWNPPFIPDPSLSVWAEHIAEHRVLHVDLDQEHLPGASATRSRGHMVWPTIDDATGEPEPVAGLQTVLATLLDRTGDPRKVAEILLLELMPGDAAAGQKWRDRAAGTSGDADDPPSPAGDSSFAATWPPPRPSNRPG